MWRLRSPLPINECTLFMFCLFLVSLDSCYFLSLDHTCEGLWRFKCNSCSHYMLKLTTLRVFYSCQKISCVRTMLITLSMQILYQQLSFVLIEILNTQCFKSRHHDSFNCKSHEHFFFSSRGNLSFNNFSRFCCGSDFVVGLSD